MILLAAVSAAFLFGAGLMLLHSHRKRLAATAKMLLEEHDADLCRKLIRVALAEQLDYEKGHKARQAERLAHVKHEKHGHYDDDQRALSVELRTRSAYSGRGTKPPAKLHELVLEELGL